MQIKRAFDEATKAIEAEVYTLYGKYATDNSLTYAEALVYLSKDEREEFQRDLAFYLEKARDKDYRQEHRAYLQALSVRARVQRLTVYMSKRSVGTNSPPLHPRCRSTTTAVLYEDNLGTRVARDVDGKTIKVPRDMTYKGWHDRYVKTNSEYVKQEKRYKNHHADQRQYERY